MSSNLKVILETRRLECLLYSELYGFNPKIIILGHFIDIKLSKILSFSVLLLTKPLDEEENKNRVKDRVQETRDPTKEREEGIPRAIQIMHLFFFCK